MDALTILRILTMGVWLIVAAFMSPAVLAILKGQPRRADPSRFGWFLAALCFVFGNLRFLLAPASETLWGAIYMLCIATGAYILWVHHNYGRGPVL